MPNMPSGPSTWGRMWQWNAQAPGFGGVDHDVEAGTRRHHQGVGHVPVLRREREPVLTHHLEVVAVQVHRVQQRSVVGDVDQDPVVQGSHSGAVAGNDLPLIT